MLASDIAMMLHYIKFCYGSYLFHRLWASFSPSWPTWYVPRLYCGHCGVRWLLVMAVTARDVSYGWFWSIWVYSSSALSLITLSSSCMPWCGPRPWLTALWSALPELFTPSLCAWPASTAAWTLWSTTSPQRASKKAWPWEAKGPGLRVCPAATRRRRTQETLSPETHTLWLAMEKTRRCLRVSSDSTGKKEGKEEQGGHDRSSEFEKQSNQLFGPGSDKHITQQIS